MPTFDDSPSLQIIRRFNAPPEAVFDALVNPDTMRKWWFNEPKTTFEIDLRAGGKWSITTWRNGKDYTASGTYLDVTPPRRLVYTIAMLQFSPNSDTLTYEIAPDGSGSVMTFTQAGTDIAAELAELAPGCKGSSQEGWEQAFEALASVLS